MLIIKRSCKRSRKKLDSVIKERDKIENRLQEIDKKYVEKLKNRLGDWNIEVHTLT